MRLLARALPALCLLPLPLHAQPGRMWHPEDRTLITSFSEISALAAGRREIFVASTGGIAIFDFVAGTWKTPLAPIEGDPGADVVSALAHDAVGDGLWVGTEFGELYRLPLTLGRMERANFRADAPIIRIAPDVSDGVLWIGTPDGWYRVSEDGDFGRFIVRAELVPAEVRRMGEEDLALQAARGTVTLDDRFRRFDITAAVTTDEPGIIHVGTDGGGLVRLDTRTLERTGLPFGTLSRGVGAIAVADDAIWFGGDGGGPRDGVARATRDLSQWVQYEAGVEGGPRGFVARIAFGEAEVWFSASDGAYRLRGEDDWLHLTSAEGLPADQTTAVVPTNGGAWIATLRGLVRVGADGESAGVMLQGRRVFDLVLAGDTLWIASDAGLLVSIGGAEPIPAGGDDPALTRGPVVALAAAGGRMAALTPAALHQYRNGRWSPDPEAASLGIGALFRVHIADDGTLTVAGETGVAMLEPDRPWRTWHVPSDIPAGPVRSLALVGNDLWVATPAGALRLDRTR